MIRPANDPAMPARRDPESLTLAIVEAPLWHPRCGHSPTDDELNAIRLKEHEAYMAWEACKTATAEKGREWRDWQVLLDKAYAAVAADGDEVVRTDEVKR